jgi:hypothetical protein
MFLSHLLNHSSHHIGGKTRRLFEYVVETVPLEKTFDVLAGGLHDCISKALITLRVRRVDLCDNIREVIAIPTRSHVYFEVPFDQILESRNGILVRDSIDQDIVEHRREILVIVELEVKFIHILDHGFDCTRMVIF